MKKHILLIASVLSVMNAVSTKAQTITAPTGQNLTIANSVNVTGGSVNIKADSSYKIAGISVLRTKNSNVFIGKVANTSMTGDYNLFMGINAGLVNTTGANNVFGGSAAGYSNTTGSANMFLGSGAGFLNTAGSNNIFLGSGAGASNTTGDGNINIGTSAGAQSTTAYYNCFIGLNTGYSNTTGGGNTFLGLGAGFYNTTGSYNGFIGPDAGRSNTTGGGNIFIGPSAGYNNTTGYNNTYIGNGAGGTAAISNSIAIGANATVTASNSVVLGNNANVGIGTSAPANKLEVVSGTAGQSGLRLTGLAGRAGNLQVNAAGDVILVASGARVAAADDANWTLTSNYLYNNSNGVVIGEGITSTPAGYKLFVSDGILTEKVKVAVKNGEDWADRVFEDNYKMLSLAQTNQYIKENKHLPGVPSTQEMIEKGNDLHKTDVILLTKIEELYRHVIKIEQENQALKKELKSLKNRKR